jgi:hypothetical protein
MPETRAFIEISRWIEAEEWRELNAIYRERQVRVLRMCDSRRRRGVAEVLHGPSRWLPATGAPRPAPYFAVRLKHLPVSIGVLPVGVHWTADVVPPFLTVVTADVDVWVLRRLDGAEHDDHAERAEQYKGQGYVLGEPGHDGRTPSQPTRKLAIMAMSSCSRLWQWKT